MRVTIQLKMLASFAAVLVLMGVVGWIGASQTQALAGLLGSMYDDSLIPVTHTSQVQIALMTRARDLRNVIIFASDEQQRAAAITSMAAQDKQVTDNLAAFDTLGNLSSEDKRLASDFRAAYGEYKAVTDQIVALASQGKANDTLAKLNDAASAVKKVADLAGALTALQVADAQKSDEAGLAAAGQAIKMVLGVLAAAVLLGLGLGFFLSRSISKGVSVVADAIQGIAEKDLAALVANSQAIAAGDLTRSLTIVSKPVNLKSNDEIGDMARSFNEMIARLQETGDAYGQMTAGLRTAVGQIAENATQLASASAQLSAASNQAGSATQQISTTIQEVARGTQEQSASVQETTASVEQLARAIDQIAKGSQDQAKSIEQTSASVAQLNSTIAQVASISKALQSAAEQSQAAAASGGDSVQKTLRGMASIKESTNSVGVRIQELQSYSEQIGSIVEAIDDIAEQTNLLALNAAIEAARAGEHGRGFAVVADEVRKLAERSSRSTKEIADLIAQVQKGTHEAVSAMDQGSKEVDLGLELAQEAGYALKEIHEGTKGAVQQVGQIASAVQQMEAASQRVVSLMDSVSAVVEESTAATEEMAASSQQVGGAIEKVAAVSEETSSSAEEVSASTEEMSAQVEELVAQSESLSAMAEELQGIVAQFKTGENVQQGAEVVALRRKGDWGGVQTRRELVKASGLR
jgi:methyl-accepting chemotaxis protein